MFLEIKNTNIGYKKPLIKGINTTLDLGQVVLLIGNNGVGKTTIIKSILGQIPLLSGKIIIQNDSHNQLSTQQIAERIAVVFSNSSIPLHYSTTDLISLGKYIHYPYYFRLDQKDKSEIQSIIQQLQLTEYKDVPLSQLSDGNLQKAMIGRAIAQNSPMIILDEPTTHLDEDNKVMILNLLRKLAVKHQKLILFSSHDWRLAKDFADKIWYIKDQTLTHGFAEEVIQNRNELHSKIDFKFGSTLILPTIIAPPFEKELMEFFLQKNAKKNVQGWNFIYQENGWKINNTTSLTTTKDWAVISALVS